MGMKMKLALAYVKYRKYLVPAAVVIAALAVYFLWLK